MCFMDSFPYKVIWNVVIYTDGNEYWVLNQQQECYNWGINIINE